MEIYTLPQQNDRLLAIIVLFWFIGPGLYVVTWTNENNKK